ncbi:basic-leucine zipper (bZIP) transcription factor family protein [Tasmannia lanceolata]|uniref:basic-leucine zipper (bZIP) transcription factor family protein n=1 Tax=Tasmannia lanceolata TaxID=3420 RepID=UPI0040649717
MEQSQNIRVWSRRRKNPSFCRQRCSASSSSTISEGYGSDRQCGSDLMVKTELDAARVLADFAEIALLEIGNPSGERWGNKGRRSRKRLKNDPLVKELPESEISCSKPRPSDLLQNHSLGDHQRHKKALKYLARKSINIQQDSELPRSSPKISSSHVSFCGGKSRETLSEAEREARRLRRVLANRESARQTIRRRQALCEELTKKAADLAWDNESMKREKELVMKEYQSLKDRNKHLKAQIDNTVKGEVKETPSETVSTLVETPISSSLHFPSLLYNRTPFSPFMWPPIYPSTAPHLPQNITELKDSPALCMANQSHELTSSGRFSDSGLQMPYYMMPYPWFFPLPNHVSVPGHLDHHALRETDRNSINSQHDTRLSMNQTGNMENSALPAEVKIDAFSSTDITAKQENGDVSPEISNGLPTDKGGQILNGMTLMPTPLRELPSPFPIKCENVLHSDSDFRETMYTNKKLMDAAVAAIARKRRRELTKLRSPHSRQLRLPC